MVIVVTYDVDTKTPLGERRLRKVAKVCERYGIRVQNSVFEVTADEAQFVVLKSELEKSINPEEDSIRFYKLGNSFQHKIEKMGKSLRIETGGPMIL